MELDTFDDSHPIFAALVEIQKPRTKFQLDHFVMGQHDTDAQKYKQVLLEFSSLIVTIKTSELEIKKNEIKISRLLETGDEIDALDAQIQSIHLEQSKLGLLGARRELADLIEIWESFEHKYTHEEIEADQSNYWNLRLHRQAQLEALGSNGQIGWGLLDALRQIGVKLVDENLANGVIE